MPTITTMSQPEAEMFKPPAGALLISIETPDFVDTKYPSPKLLHWDYVVSLRFHDSDPKRWDSSKHTHMGLLDANMIIGTIKAHPWERVYVHCWAGLSRSNAVARFIADTFGYKLGHCASEDLMNKHVYSTLFEAYNLMKEQQMSSENNDVDVPVELLEKSKKDTREYLASLNDEYEKVVAVNPEAEFLPALKKLIEDTEKFLQELEALN